MPANGQRIRNARNRDVHDGLCVELKSIKSIGGPSRVAGLHEAVTNGCGPSCDDLCSLAFGSPPFNVAAGIDTTMSGTTAELDSTSLSPPCRICAQRATFRSNGPHEKGLYPALDK